MQKPSKKAKNTAAGTNILPQKAKVLLFPPPPPYGNLPFIHGGLRETVTGTVDQFKVKLDRLLPTIADQLTKPG